MRAGIARLLAVSTAVVLLAPLGGPARSQVDYKREQRLSPVGNDWEPAVAADDEGQVVIATTRYGAPPACADCPRPFIAYKRSEDGGETWSGRRYLCRCPGSKYQYDPVLASDDRGRLFAVWLDGFRPGVMFSRSDDFGKTWTEPNAVAAPKVSWSDKPWLAVSHDGQDVYVTFNGYRHGWEWGVVSYDAGETWESPKLMPHAHPRFSRYYFASGMTVLPNGTALAAITAWRQKYHVGNVLLEVMRTTDEGKTWQMIPIGESAHGRRCPDFGHCAWGFLGPQMAIAADEKGNAYVLYNRFDKPNAEGRLFFRSSKDGGKSWAAERELADVGADSEFPMIVATGDGDVRIAWMDNRTGHWSTWYRRSTNGGDWGETLLLSDRPGGAGYKSPEGYHFPYGDYGQIAIDGDGASWVTWGEGYSWFGPGGTWYQRVPEG